MSRPTALLLVFGVGLASFLGGAMLNLEQSEERKLERDVAFAHTAARLDSCLRERRRR